MEKLKLSDLDKFVLLSRANRVIRSLANEEDGNVRYAFISALECHDVKFSCGAFSKKNGARVEVVYKYRNCTIRLLWLYVPKKYQELFYEDFVFIPKAITIEREFKHSILLSIVPDSDNNSIYLYQSTKSIIDLCEGGSDEGDAEGAHAGVCLAEVDDDSTTPKK